MPRIRTIKPEFPQSESMGRVSRDARLTFILLWTIADDSGRLRGNSRMLASLLFPYDDDARESIDGWLGELEVEGSIVRYHIGDDAYIQITKWSEHQKIDRPSKPKFPGLGDTREDSRESREGSSLDQGSRSEGPRTKGSRSEGPEDQGPESPEPKAPDPKTKDTTRPKRTPKAKETPEQILGGGRGTPAWESYWKLSGTFGPGKNLSPTITARLYVQAIETTTPESIQAAAEALLTSRQEQRFMPQLRAWLEGQGYAQPVQPRIVSTGGKHGIDRQHRFTGRDEDLRRQLEARGGGGGGSTLPDVRKGDDPAGAPGAPW